jgi:hypothetical protein
MIPLSWDEEPARASRRKRAHGKVRDDRDRRDIARIGEAWTMLDGQ